ncbi:ubiquitin carboxyl-terminal hydrolase 10-like, partial [Trifolium medium]|nr:ubiquitin carboxyl-terminal hydrolase 10-like [Trifolium medium]
MRLPHLAYHPSPSFYWKAFVSHDSNPHAVHPIKDGQLKSAVVCLTCAKTSITFDPFMYTLPHPSTVTQQEATLFSCLEAFLTVEHLGPENMWNHYGCVASEHYTAYAKLIDDNK